MFANSAATTFTTHPHSSQDAATTPQKHTNPPCTQSQPHQPTTSTSMVRMPARRQLLSCMAACAALTATPLPARAENVRLADVKNPTLQAGIRAATEGRWADAERLFQIVLKEEPDLASAWSNLGNVHLQLGRPQQALIDYDQAVSLAGYAPVPYVNRALAHESLALLPASSPSERQSQFKAALSDLDTAIQLDGKEFTAFFNRGNVLMRMGEYPAARVELQYNVLLLYCTGNVLMRLGNVLMRMGEYPAARDSYRQAADLAPGIAGYRLRSATLLFQCGQLSEAVATTKGVLRKNPQYGEAHLALAAMYWSQGNSSMAEEQFERATSLDYRFGDRRAVAELTLWPPGLYDALDDFMSFTVRNGK